MSLFGKKKRMQRMMNMVQNMNITSKASLKQFCIVASKGDLDEADRLYNYFIKDMEDLPMFDPVPPNWMEKTKNAANGIFGFIKENQDGIVQGIDFIRGMFGKGGVPNVPAGAEPTPPLPPIN